jgi:hypothetical protein
LTLLSITSIQDVVKDCKVVLNDSKNKRSYQSVNIASDVWIGMVSILQIHTPLINIHTSLGNMACDVWMLISNVNRLTTNRLSRMTSWNVNLHIACNV